MTPQDLESGEIVLASNSRIRAGLLRQAGIRFTATSASVDELRIRSEAEAQGIAPDKIAQALAEAKAQAVSARLPHALVLGCDQILLFEGRVLGKCADLAQARRLLSALRGKRHRLISAAAFARNGKILWRHSEPADLTMHAFDDAFLERYLQCEGGEILSCVGCYRFEGPGIQLFDRLDGDYFSVLGLPLQAVISALRTFGGKTL